jgi:ATP-binding cassette, subfamily B, bacterial
MSEKYPSDVYVWRGLQPLLPAKSRFAAGLLAVESLVAGMLEAILLVLVVAVAVAVTDDAEGVDLSVPLLGQTELTPGVALGVAGLAGIVVLMIHVHSAWVTARLSAGVLRTARDRSIAAFARASWARQALDREGALQETVSSLSSRTSELVTHLSNFASGGIGLAAMLLAAVIVDPIVTFVVLFFGVLIFFALRPVGRLTRSRSNDYVERNSGFTEQVSQWSTLAMELRVLGVEDSEAARLAEENRVTSHAFTQSRFVSRLGGLLYRDVATLFLVGAVAALNWAGDVDIGAVGAVVLLIVRSLSYAQGANTSLQQMNEQSPNLDSLMTRLKSLETAAEPVGHQAIEAVTRVEFHDVGYDYERGRPGVDGVTIEIAAGEVVGVIGPSGGGKSTLVQVLLRLRPPTQGTVTVSDIVYQEIEPESWHRLVNLVPQEPKLFQGTVVDNISFFRPSITREQVERSAAAAHVLNDIRRLPDGFDTELGPRGAGLSGGQKQRIAIARALAGEPQLLVLDEPTSALDVRSEQLLVQTIEELKGSITLVIVAHRLTTLACCERVIAMEDGRVKMIGSLQEALAQVSFDDDEKLAPVVKPRNRASDT